MAYFPNRAGVAMAAQVVRVNQHAAAFNVEDDLRAQLNAARRRIMQLEERIAELEDGGMTRGKSGGALDVKGRPVMTMKQAADAAGVSVATVSRYCDQSRWESTKVGGRVLIYADQPLVKKENGRRQRGNV